MPLIRSGGQPSGRSAVQPSWNHAFVSFNNQDTILMSMYIKSMSLLCLLHDNRIFGFKRTYEYNEENEEKTSSSSSSHSNCKISEQDENTPTNEQNLILNLLTTPKYRGMAAIYLVFLLTDHMGLLFFIVKTIMRIGDKEGTSLTPAETALISTIGIELFYDIMIQTHKFWNLQRLSIYIGIFLYFAYFTIVLTQQTYEGEKKKLLLSVLIVRFVAFISEELVDIAIDGALHNDLWKLQKRKEVPVETFMIPARVTETETDTLIEFRPRPKKSCWSRLCSRIKDYLSIRNIEMPPNVDYRGSFFAWLPWSVFYTNVWSKDPFPTKIILLFCLVPLSLMVTVLIFLLPILIIAAVVTVFFCLITCNWEVVRQLKYYFQEIGYF